MHGNIDQADVSQQDSHEFGSRMYEVKAAAR
jgi:hypothetical protein